jgi:arsenate reductase
MAQAFFERYAPADLRAESAGQDPPVAIHPEVIETMAEVGIDLSDRRPKRLTVEMQLHADWAITMGCGGTCPYVPTTVEEWGIADPAGRSKEEVRKIRDDIAGRVEDLIFRHTDDIRSDDSGHKRRLTQLLPRLIEEFEGQREPEEIRACTDAVLSSFDDAPIRGHVLSLAQRRTADCLRADTCEELASV